MSWALQRDGKNDRVRQKASVRQPPLSAGQAELALPARTLAQADALHVEFTHPNGNHVVSHRFTLKETPAASGLNPALPDGLPIPRFNLVTRVTAS